MSEDRLSQMLHNETEHISAAQLSPQARRRIRLRQGSLLTGVAASLVALTMVAMSFASGPLKNEVAGDGQPSPSPERTAPGRIEVVTPAGSGEIWGRNFEIDRHRWKDGERNCYVLKVQGRGKSDCFRLQRGSSNYITVGGDTVQGWNRAFLLIDAQRDLYLGAGFDVAGQVWMSEPPFDERELTLVVFNRPRAEGTLVKLDPVVREDAYYELALLETVSVDQKGVAFARKGPTDLNLGLIVRCPRLLLPDDRGAALEAVEEWAEFVQPKEATGFSDISLGEAPAEASGCPDWVAERSLTASFSWQGGPFDDSASLSQVRVLVGKTLDGEWEVWRQEH